MQPGDAVCAGRSRKERTDGGIHDVALPCIVAHSKRARFLVEQVLHERVHLIHFYPHSLDKREQYVCRSSRRRRVASLMLDGNRTNQEMGA